MNGDAAIEQIDPMNRPALAAWHATVVASERFGREDVASPWELAEVRASQLAQDDAVKGIYAGIDHDRVVVAGELSAPLRHSMKHAEISVHTHPDHRRRGHGTAMLTHLTGVARGLGRTVLGAETSWPYDAPADGRGTPGADFLSGHGFRFGLGDVMRVLDLPVPDDELDRLAAEAAPHHAAYPLRSFVGPVPEDIVESYLALTSRLMVEAPTGEMEREQESVDVGALRRQEALIGAQGRTRYTTVALDAGGQVAAYSDAVTGVHVAGMAFQWGTLVRRRDRGHRLGLAVKAALLRLLQAEGPPVPQLRTWNAESNTHMVGINERLGFRPVERLGEFQRRL